MKVPGSPALCSADLSIPSETRERPAPTVNRRDFLSRSAAVAGLLGTAVGVGTFAPSEAQAFAASASDNSGIVNVKSLGASGNGQTDDSSAIQRAVNAAQMVGGTVFFPPGTYALGTSIFVSARVTILGCGWEGQGGGTYKTPTQYLTKSSGYRGSVILPPSSSSAFLCATDDAIIFRDIQISYPGLGAQGTCAIVIRASDGPQKANCGSLIEYVCVTGADTAVSLRNCLDYKVINCEFTGIQLAGLVSECPNFPDWGDAVIMGNLVWLAGTPRAAACYAFMSGGGFRLVNNKGNGGGKNSSSVLAYLSHPQPHTTRNMQPFVCTGNSMEGAAHAAFDFRVAQGNTNATMSTVVISGNQGWAGNYGVVIEKVSASPWVLGLVISGNHFMTNSGPGKAGIKLDGVDGAAISGNVVGSHKNEGSGYGIDLGGQTSNISVTGNVVQKVATTISSGSSGFVPARNAGTQNKVS